MTDSLYNSSATTMSAKTFSRFSAFIKTEIGINMPDAKKTMLQARLQKRLRKLGIKTFEEYYDYVFSPAGVEKELANMIDVITTNKTDFFREPQHFDYLVQTVLPELISTRGMKKKAMVWSAGCSSGEEVYTLAMVLSEFSYKFPGFQYSILGTDISTKVLKEAVVGIYDHEKVEPVPLTLRKKYLLRSKDKEKQLVRIAPELRSLVSFRRVNFMENDLGIREAVDIIFCRNVLIYFDRPTQEKVLNRLCRYLKPGGYMFMGHSETLSGLNVSLIPACSTVYKNPR
ncbi:MAG: protein-glutamate O-methyltransferase [Desulfobacteraceae bacterium]|nr:protein-glutamate O-methyltransferase [Desulfobacteraceae bacterium]